MCSVIPERKSVCLFLGSKMTGGGCQCRLFPVLLRRALNVSDVAFYSLGRVSYVMAPRPCVSSVCGKGMRGLVSLLFGRGNMLSINLSCPRRGCLVCLLFRRKICLGASYRAKILCVLGGWMFCVLRVVCLVTVLASSVAVSYVLK